MQSSKKRGVKQGIDQIKDGCLYLRYGSISEKKPQQREPKHLHTRNLCYTITKTARRVMPPRSEAEKIKLENFDFVIILSSLFFLLLHHT